MAGIQEMNQHDAEKLCRRDVRAFVRSALNHWKELVGGSLIAIGLECLLDLWDLIYRLVYSGIAVAFAFVWPVFMHGEMRGEMLRGLRNASARQLRVSYKAELPGCIITEGREPYRQVNILDPLKNREHWRRGDREMLLGPQINRRGTIRKSDRVQADGSVFS